MKQATEDMNEMIILRGIEEKEDARNVPALIAIFTLDYFVWTTAEASMSCEITNVE